MHDCVGVGPAAVRQLDVVEPDAPGAVVLLQAVGLGCEVGNGLVLLCYLLLEGKILGIGVAEQLLQCSNFGRECLQGSEFG